MGSGGVGEMGSISLMLPKPLASEEYFSSGLALDLVCLIVSGSGAIEGFWGTGG